MAEEEGQEGFGADFCYGFAGGEAKLQASSSQVLFRLPPPPADDPPATDSPLATPPSSPPPSRSVSAAENGGLEEATPQQMMLEQEMYEEVPEALELETYETVPDLVLAAPDDPGVPAKKAAEQPAQRAPAPAPTPAPTPALIPRRDSGLPGDSNVNDNAREQDECPIYASCFGYLQKLSTGPSKQWKRRWMVLKESCALTYFKTAKASTTKGAEAASIDLTGYSVLRAFDLNKPHSFKAVHPTKRTFYFAASDESDASRWAAALTAAIERLDKRRALREEQVARLSKQRSAILQQFGDLKALEQQGAEAVLEGCRCHGFLDKKTEVSTSWARYYFVLKGGVLHFFTSPSAKNALGVIVLPGYELSLPSNTVNEFQINHPGSRTWIFRADTGAEGEMWTEDLRHACNVENSVSLSC